MFSSRLATKIHIQHISTYPKLNLSDDPKLARLEATLEPGIVSERCIDLFNWVVSSKVALRCPLKSIGLSLYIVLLLCIAIEGLSIAGFCSACACAVSVCSSSHKAPKGSFWVTGVRGDILWDKEILIKYKKRLFEFKILSK